jgi:hypothetical protein
MNKIDGSTSDGFHTFDELYKHRNALFIALMKSYPHLSWWAKADDIPEWLIAGMHLPSGDITYHMSGDYEVALSGLIERLPQPPKFDGHSPDDVVKRLLDWTEHGS